MSNIEATYQKLIENSLYEEAFLLLNNNIKNANAIQTSLLVDEFLKEYLTDNNIKSAKNKGHLISYISSFINNIQNNKVFDSFIIKLPSMISVDNKKLIFKDLVMSNQDDTALKVKSLFEITPILKEHQDLMFEIADKNNLNAVSFVCKEMEDIHFHNDALLRLLSERDISVIEFLLVKYGFDINTQSNETNLNLLSVLIEDNSYEKFSYFVNKYANKINWGLKYGENKEDNLFSLVEKKPNNLKFLESLLNHRELSGFVVANITKMLLDNKALRSNAVNTKLYSQLFSHENFDKNDYKSSSTDLLYIIMGKMGNAMFYQKDDLTKEYAHILNNYVESLSDKRKLPIGKNYHALGALISILTEIRTKKEISDIGKELLIECLHVIAKKEPELVNTKNPNSVYPVLMNNDKDIYNALLENDAVPKVSDKGFINAIKIFFNYYKPSVDEALIREYFAKKAKEKEKDSNINKNLTITEIIDMKFKSILNKLKDKNIDIEISNKVIDIYNKSMEIGEKIEKQNINELYKEKHFLIENTPVYTDRSLTIYLELFELNQMFKDVSDNAEIEKSKIQCLEQLNVLDRNLDKVNKNVYVYAHEKINTSGKVHDKILEVKSNEMEEMEMSMDITPEKDVNENTQPFNNYEEDLLLTTYGDIFDNQKFKLK